MLVNRLGIRILLQGDGTSTAISFSLDKIPIAITDAGGFLSLSGIGNLKATEIIQITSNVSLASSTLSKNVVTLEFTNPPPAVSGGLTSVDMVLAIEG
jgi:hypothetical protein